MFNLYTKGKSLYFLAIYFSLAFETLVHLLVGGESQVLNFFAAATAVADEQPFRLHPVVLEILLESAVLLYHLLQKCGLTFFELYHYLIDLFYESCDSSIG